MGPSTRALCRFADVIFAANGGGRFIDDTVLSDNENRPKALRLLYIDTRKWKSVVIYYCDTVTSAVLYCDTVPLGIEFQKDPI